MALFEIAFAVGAIAVAGLVGGILYVLYPSSFDGPMNTVGTDPTSGTPYTAPEALMNSPAENSTAGANSTSASNGTDQQPSDGGY